MFLFWIMKHILLYICNHYFYLLDSKFYIVDTPLAYFQFQINLLWEYDNQKIDLTTFVFKNSDWFFDTLYFI